MKEIVCVKFAVSDVQVRLHGHQRAFANALDDFESKPWVKFLREHGELETVEHYSKYDTQETIYLTNWGLSAELKTWFCLCYSDAVFKGELQLWPPKTTA